MTVRRDDRTGNWIFRTVVRKPDGERPRLFGTARLLGFPNTKVGAQEAEREAIAKALGKILPGAPSINSNIPTKEVPTLREFSETWIAKCKTDNKRSTVLQRESNLKCQILPDLGHLRLDEITFSVLEDYRVALSSRVKPGTRHLVLTLLRCCLWYAKDRGLIAEVPRIDCGKPSPAKTDFLTFEESEQLIAHAPGEYAAMIRVAIETGLRHGELTGLRWEDVDFAGRRLLVRNNMVLRQVGTPKGGSMREVPLTESALAALQGQRHERGPWVFCTESGGSLPLCQTQHWLSKAANAAGLRHVSWHITRHTFASHLVMLGAPLRSVQALLGHKSIRDTERYSHLSPQVTRDAVSLLDGRSRLASPLPDPARIAAQAENDQVAVSNDAPKLTVLRGGRDSASAATSDAPSDVSGAASGHQPGVAAGRQ